MIQAISKRLNREEKGFTLIELMVVVLIIAILIAIAVPTFLGARKRAQARAAQSNVRNAYSAAKVYFADQETFSNSATSGDAGPLITELGNLEPGLTFGTAVSTTDNKVVGVQVADTTDAVVNGVVCLSVEGADAVVYTLRDISSALATAAVKAGVSYTTSASGAALPACNATTAWAAKW